MVITHLREHPDAVGCLNDGPYAIFVPKGKKLKTLLITKNDTKVIITTGKFIKRRGKVPISSIINPM